MYPRNKTLPPFRVANKHKKRAREEDILYDEGTMWVFIILGLAVIVILMVFIRAYQSRKNPNTVKAQKRHDALRDQAEERVDELLRSLAEEEGGYVYHDIFLQESEGDSSELDHIYLCKAGIFLIETKGAPAVIKGQMEDPAWKAREGSDNKDQKILNPITQNQAHLQRLAALWGGNMPKVYLMAVFPYGNITLVSDVAFNLKTAEEFMRDHLATPDYSEEEVKQFNACLLAMVKKHGITREEHYENVRHREQQ